MNILRAIRTRRSVKKFKDKKPDWRKIIEAINSAQFAPMAGKMFSLKFVIIDEPELIKKVAAWSEQPFINKAQYIVAVVSNPKATAIYKERSERYMRQQAGAAIQNFMLHLTSLGLSTCWVGHFNDDKIKNILKIPNDQELEAVFPIGYEKDKPKANKTKGDLYEILYFNEWKRQRMKKREVIEGRYLGKKINQK